MYENFVEFRSSKVLLNLSQIFSNKVYPTGTEYYKMFINVFKLYRAVIVLNDY